MHRRYITAEHAEGCETFEMLKNAVAFDASTYFGQLDRSRFIGQHGYVLYGYGATRMRG